VSPQGARELQPEEYPQLLKGEWPTDRVADQYRFEFRRVEEGGAASGE
jgi:hypothetical protein